MPIQRSADLALMQVRMNYFDTHRGEITFPVAVLSSYCQKFTRTVVSTNAHGVMRREVQFSFEEFEKQPVRCYIGKAGVIIEGRYIKKTEDINYVLVLVTGTEFNEAKHLIGRKIVVNVKNVSELV